MPDREHDELVEKLRELGYLIEYPPAPDVSRAVKLRLEDEASERPRRLRWFRTLARPKTAVATVATVLLFLSILSPAMRATLSDFISAGASGGAAGGAAEDAAGSSSAEYAAEETPQPAGETIEATEPPAGAAAGASAASGSPSALGFGRIIPPSEADAVMGGLLLPGSPEFASGPTSIYAVGSDGADGVVVVFGPGPGLPSLGGTDAGLILVEVPGDPRFAYPASDGVYATAEEVDVGGVRGYWFPDGRSLLLTQPGDAERLPGGALVWERDGVALLLRADTTRREAVGIARTVR